MMTRTIKGSRPRGFEYCGKRLGNQSWSGGVDASDKRITHRKERMQAKRIVREQTKAVT